MQAKDLQTKSREELVKLIEDLKAELFMLRFRNSTGQLEQPHKIKLIKKDIARVFTVINSKDAAKTEVKTEVKAKKEVKAKAEVKTVVKEAK